MPQVRDGLLPWPTMILPSITGVANALSRIKWQHDDAVVVKTILARGLNADTSIPHPFEQICIQNVNLTGTPKLSKEDWVKEQGGDEDISPVVKLVRLGNIYSIHVKKEIHWE